MDCKEILMGVKPDIQEEAIRNICGALVEKGLSFRQAEALLDIAKERLKDAKI